MNTSSNTNAPQVAAPSQSTPKMEKQQGRGQKRRACEDCCCVPSATRMKKESKPPSFDELPVAVQEFVLDYFKSMEEKKASNAPPVPRPPIGQQAMTTEEFHEFLRLEGGWD